MAPIEAKNYQCKMGFRGFETRNLGNLRQFFTIFEVSRLKNWQYWLHWLECRPCLFFLFFTDTAYTGPFNTRGASNVLLIVVLIIISIAFIVFTLIFGKKFVVMFCKENNLPRNNSPSPPSNELFRINRRDNR